MKSPFRLPKKAHVDIVEVRQGVPYRIARVGFADGAVQLEGEDDFLQELRQGVFDSLTGKTFQPEDGYGFLLTLPVAYNSPYLFAKLVEEES